MNNFIKATSLQGMDSLVTHLGGDITQIMTQFGLNIPFNKLAQQYMPYSTYAELLEHCAHTLNCPSFGLQLANKQSFEILGPIAIAAKSSTNLGDALSWVIKYLHLHTPALSLTIHPLEADKTLFLSFQINLNPLPKTTQVLELTIGLAMGVIKKLSNNACKPQAVFLPQKQPINTRAYNTYFGCKVTQNRNSAGIVILKTDLALMVAQPQYDKVPAALQFLAQSKQHNQSLPTQVSALIRPMLPIYQCTNEIIAKALGMHPRTLHRELSKHNTSFVKLKDSTRRSLAAHYLAQNHYSISTISELLGYQEQATLSASVKRWFGYSPRAYRSKKMINSNKHYSKE